jgi:hypothetical protein
VNDQERGLEGIRDTSMRMGDVKRATGPETKNGRDWEVQLSAVPSREWLDLFKLAAQTYVTVPLKVVFDRDVLFFKSDEKHVEQWIRSIDEGIASTNERHANRLAQASDERARRHDAETTERERIRQLNERFKNL